jgi:hypothetical protein
MSGYTEEQKLDMYLKGEYSFKVPPVSHHAWTREDWIRWIDGCGIWQPKGTHSITQSEVDSLKDRLLGGES